MHESRAERRKKNVSLATNCYTILVNIITINTIKHNISQYFEIQY